jgi:GNAT superfamily N-acetyltransferase
VKAGLGTAIEIRPYRGADEAGVLELLEASLGGAPSGSWGPDFFRWKHLANPFGKSFMLVAEQGGRIIGLRAFLRWRFRAGTRSVQAVRAVDTATHPDFQGQGVFSRLTRKALDVLRDEVDLVFNTPNEKSLQGYLKMGWSAVGRIPVSIRVRRPIRLARHVRSLAAPAVLDTGVVLDAPPASQVLRFQEPLEALLAGAGSPEPRIHTEWDLRYLRWRYGEAPLDYRVVEERQGDRLLGAAIFRVRRRGVLVETAVAELLAAPGDGQTARRLLRRVIAAAQADYVTCLFPRGSPVARATRRSGFLPAPRGVTFVVNQLRSDVRPDPADLRSWALSLGDVEVF